jgi:hypothetical protein
MFKSRICCAFSLRWLTEITLLSYFECKQACMTLLTCCPFLSQAQIIEGMFDAVFHFAGLRLFFLFALWDDRSRSVRTFSVMMSITYFSLITRIVDVSFLCRKSLIRWTWFRIDCWSLRQRRVWQLSTEFNTPKQRSDSGAASLHLLLLDFKHESQLKSFTGSVSDRPKFWGRYIRPIWLLVFSSA